MAIVILNWNGKEHTIECLDSLRTSDYPNSEIIVIDNGSIDGSQSVLRKKFPEVTLIESKNNLGYTGGNNLGMECAINHGANYVFLLNNDTKVRSNTISELVKAISMDERIGIVGSKILDYHKPTMIQFAGESSFDFRRGIPIARERGGLDVGQYEEPHHVEFIGGCAMMIKVEVIKHVGYFDPIYFAYFEDEDYCVRALDAGYKLLYCPTSVVLHKGSISTGGQGSLIESYYMNRNRLLFVRKYMKRWKLLFFVFYYLQNLLRKDMLLAFKSGHKDRLKNLVSSALEGLTMKVAKSDITR